MRGSSLTKDQLSKRISRAVEEELNNYIEKKSDFTPLFIDKLGYVIYRRIGDDKEKRILIGRSVMYLNYVSFSYNSRYLAFGAKMDEDTFRHSKEGVFVLYDLVNEETVVRKDKEEGLYAVWMTMFSRNGDVAYYDSHANAFIQRNADNYDKTIEISGKSLLCFSPSGKYIAFSDQKYVDFEHHSNEDWGHQPSGNIFIHKLESPDKCIEQFNDFSYGIKGVSFSAQSVASAAFSSDERKLLAVGEDGVIVIRNLKGVG